MRHRLDDGQRLSTLERLDLLSLTPNAALDRLTRMASRMLVAPMATVSIVDDHRQVFKSQVGMTGSPVTPLSHSFCQHVVTSGEPLIVADARFHDTLRDNPAIAESGVIAYAGLPMVTKEGDSLGSFCVIDTKPREWTPEEISILSDLREAAMVELELREFTVQLEAERRIREETTSLLVHDFRTPLATIIAAAQTAIADSNSVDEMLGITLAGAYRMQSLINDLLDVARFETKGMQPTRERTDLSRLAKEVAAQLGNLAKESHMVFRVEGQGDCEAMIDKGMTHRVLENLLSNAIRYGAAGSEICVEVAATGHGSVRCSVTNRGQGIPPGLEGVIFTKYGRVDGAKNNMSSPSSGLGLRFCKLCVDAHGGTIGYSSEPGDETTFWFEVPCAQE